MPGAAAISHVPLWGGSWPQSRSCARGHAARQQRLRQASPHSLLASAPLPACSQNWNDLWSWQMDLNIMPIFWINSWGHFPKRCILLTLSLFAGLINWAVPALKWESNTSKHPQLLCFDMYLHLYVQSIPTSPIDVSSTAVATQGCRAAGLSRSSPGLALVQLARSTLRCLGCHYGPLIPEEDSSAQHCSKF